MKISTTNLIPFVFLLCFSQLVSALSIVAKEETPYIGNDLPGQGLSIEIINTAFERAGYKVSVVFESWPRAYEGALIGVYDVLGCFLLTLSRREVERDQNGRSKYSGSLKGTL